MKSVLIMLLLVSTNVFAFEEDPKQRFDASNKETSQSTVTWITVENVQMACEAESKRMGFNGFGYGVRACSFQYTSQGKEFCKIITRVNPNLHEIGHEMRHCFQSNWHK